MRQIAADQPRVTKFKINWDSPNANAEGETANGCTGQDSEMIEDSSSNVMMKTMDKSQETKIQGNTNEGLVFEQ